MNIIIANKYKDMLMSLDIEVIKSLEGVYDVEDIIKSFSNFYYERMILDITALKDYKNLDVLQKLSINLDAKKIILVLDEISEENSREYLSKLISMGFYNFTRNLDGIKYLINNPHTYRDVAHLHNINEGSSNETVTNTIYVNSNDTAVSRLRVIGLKNLTSGAGATTLTYLLLKNLESNYSVKAIEVDKTDFAFFEEENTISTTKEELPKELMKNNDLDIILVDLNNYNDDEICDDVLYLVEPSKIKLNKLMKKNSDVFEELKDKKIVLNKSFVKKDEEKDFEYESKTIVFANIPPLNDRNISNESINLLLSKLGLKQNLVGDTSTNNKLFGLFKF